MGSKPLKKKDLRKSILLPAKKHSALTSFSERTNTDSAKVPKSALTPLSRLKRFQKVRDKNLRKSLFGKFGSRKDSMMEAITATMASEAVVSEVSKEKLSKGENSTTHEKKLENGNLNGIAEEDEVIENGHQNGLKDDEISPRRSSRNKLPPQSPTKSPKAEEKSGSQDGKYIGGIEEVVTEEGELETEGEADDEIPLVSSYKMSSLEYEQDSDNDNAEYSPYSRTEEAEQDWEPYRMSRGIRISGRPGIREYGKRKAEDDGGSSTKRMAYTPSVSSPGWKFFSSPFTRFWPQAAKPENDSMVVNVSATSTEEVSFESPSNHLDNDKEDEDEAEESFEKPTSTPKNKQSWLCSVM